VKPGLLDRGPVRVRCRIGLARIYREQTRYDEAVALLRETLPEATGFRLAAQIRYEWGRTHIEAGKFAEGRAVLEAETARLERLVDLARTDSVLAGSDR